MNRHLLVVDDSPTQRRLAAKILQGAGFEITEAENGHAGLELALKANFDAVVTDLNMPVMDGLAFTDRLRAIPETAALPVLMVTTESSDQMRELGRSMGTTGWLAKPYEPQALVRSVRRICP